MSRKDAIDSLYLKKREPSSGETEKPTERVRSGAIGAMGASLKQMTDGAKLATRLQEQLEKGDVVVEVEPELIDHSPVADRIPIDVDPTFDELVASISENGQQVPILVRPSPATRGLWAPETASSPETRTAGEGDHSRSYRQRADRCPGS